jgi:eukaryotic-like serine/threonine-protein kinase
VSRPAESSWSWRTGDPISEDLLAWTKLGEGDRCESWLAWSTSRWCAVTVKVLRPDLVDDPRGRALLRAEGERLGTLAHPGLQRLLADELDTTAPRLVLEYVEGPTLDDLLDDGPLTPEETIALGMHLAAALHYLHLRGLTHLDVKPGNVVVRDGRPVLIDLGLVREIGEPNAPGGMRGTLDYMAPEQCRCEPADPSMDLFAVGALLHEVVTGEPAFEADDDDRPQQLSEPALSIRTLRPDAPGGLAALVTGLLEPDPRRRTPSCAAGLLAALGELLPADARTWPDWASASLDRRHGDDRRGRLATVGPAAIIEACG